MAVSQQAQQSVNRDFRTGLARAFAGALIFALPLLMTMEMWIIGTSISPVRLIVLIILFVPLLVRLSYDVGFEPTFDLKEDAVDAFVAYAVGFITAAGILLLIHIIKPGMSASEIIGKIVLQAVPASIGAMLAQSQLMKQDDDERADKRERDNSYIGQLFLMVVGALFLSLNLAPTEEIVLLAYKMPSLLTIGLAVFTLAIMHAFVYTVEFRGQHEHPQDTSFVSLFLRYTVVGYALALLMALYVLWTFGNLDGLALSETVSTAVVLGFPAGVGAAAARLIV